MKGLRLPSNVTRGFGKAKLTLSEHSSDITMVIGVITLVGSIAEAIHGTFKFMEHLKTYESNLEKINKVQKAQEAGQGDEELMSIDIKAAKREAALELAKGGVKSYWPTAVLGVGSVVSFGASVGLMKAKYLRTSAVLATTIADKTFLENAVRDKYGEEELRNLQTEMPDEKEINAHVDESTGKVVEEPKSPVYHSIFAKFFDEANPNWTKSPEDNRMFLQQKEQMANWYLENRGYLFLNDVYASLGIPKTKAGEICGWIWNPDGGIHQVSFGIFRKDSEAARAFVNGFERSILLEFNCERTPIIGDLPMEDQ